MASCLRMSELRTAASRRRALRSRGFTLMEILTVVAIILILLGMLYVGTRYLTNRTRNDATFVAFQTAKAMQGAWDSSGTTKPLWDPNLLNWGPAWSASSPPTEVSPGDVREELNEPAPLFIVITGISGRGGTAVRHTRDVMTQLCRMPENAAILATLPPKVLLRVPTPTGWASSTTYNQYHLVLATDNQRYYSLENNNADPIPSTKWKLDFTSPVLLDGWGNPILYVPEGGLTFPAFDSTVSYDVGVRVSNSGKDFRCIAKPPAPNTLPSVQTYWSYVPPVVSPDGRPFWASAGPDGDFTTDDDNVYSYE